MNDLTPDDVFEAYGELQGLVAEANDMIKWTYAISCCLISHYRSAKDIPKHILETIDPEIKAAAISYADQEKVDIIEDDDQNDAKRSIIAKSAEDVWPMFIPHVILEKHGFEGPFFQLKFEVDENAPLSSIDDIQKHYLAGTGLCDGQKEYTTEGAAELSRLAGFEKEISPDIILRAFWAAYDDDIDTGDGLQEWFKDYLIIAWHKMQAAGQTSESRFELPAAMRN